MAIGADIPDYVFRSFVEQLESKGFYYLGSGSFRKTWARKNVVVKIPSNLDGVVDNRVEASVWRRYRNQPNSFGYHFAPCRLLPNGCLMMVKVEWRDMRDEDRAEWIRFIDSNQVGKYKGRVVAYDYALDVPERIQLEKDWGIESVFFHSRWLGPREYLRTGEKPKR